MKVSELLREGSVEETKKKIEKLLTDLGFSDLFFAKSGGTWYDIAFHPPKGMEILRAKQLMYRTLKKSGLVKKLQDIHGAALGAELVG